MTCHPRTQSQMPWHGRSTDGRLVFFISHRILLVNVGKYSTMDPMDIYGFCFLQQPPRADDVWPLEAIAWSVMPLSAAAYIFQLLALFGDLKLSILLSQNLSQPYNRLYSQTPIYDVWTFQPGVGWLQIAFRKYKNRFISRISANTIHGFSRWWFQCFFMLIPIWGIFPFDFWPIFFRWVETTNEFFVSTTLPGATSTQTLSATKGAVCWGWGVGIVANGDFVGNVFGLFV